MPKVSHCFGDLPHRGHLGAAQTYVTADDTVFLHISPGPILMIIGEKALTSVFTQTAFANAAEPKELVVVPDCNHVDLYDDVTNDVTKIPFEKMDHFLQHAFL